MTYLVAIGGGLLAGTALGFGWGWLAAVMYSNIAGARDGGPAMAGFFTMGPIGLLGGFLLTTGWILRSQGTNPSISKGMLWAGAVVMVLGSIVFLVPFVSSSGSRAKYTLAIEFEVPAELQAESFQWGYQGHAAEAKADYPFHNIQEQGRFRILHAEIAMSDMPARRLALLRNETGTMQSFEIPIEGPVRQETSWSEWLPGAGVRFRWRMH